MSVNPDMSATMGVADEYVDLEHQVIKQDITLEGGTQLEVVPGDEGAEFNPGERQLDREEIAQLVYYRRYAAVQFNLNEDDSESSESGVIDASVGINGDLFRPVTTENVISPEFTVQSGGEIGLLDNYTLSASSGANDQDAYASAADNVFCEFAYDFYDWPTGGPIVDSFDTITCGFFAVNNSRNLNDCRFELRYDFYWDVAEQGRSTNPFGRPSTR